MGRPSLSKGFTLFLRILFALMVAALIMIGVLKLLERTGDPLRQGVERALADMTKGHVYLESLPDPEFFPNIHLTLDGITVGQSDDATERLWSAEKIEFSVPFTGIIFGNPAFHTFSFKNVRLEKDKFYPRTMIIDEAGIENKPPTPVFLARGRLGDTPLTIRLDVKEKSGNPARFTLGKDAPMVFTLGGVVVTGRLHGDRNGLMLQRAEMKGDGGSIFGPADFFILKNQSFVKDNPVSCLLDQSKDLKLTPAHPCATLFDQTTKEDAE